ncbi:CMP-N-acetylneuraminate-beta-1,4-galactoside alpha-2,3-sialyltransferase-like [Branchiostoma lanceolatum]|uniref:CMP-N-acetylneuraminate-beta-1,4-galactoside alpha-2,3-sialyltransferase-like n=1 Tax=Branchiostoma lanceolatum TaxID=7740 RepID=UPI00345111F5
MNDAPVKGYERDVGSRTDFRFFYPESSTLNQADLDPGAYYVVVMYKSNDLNWLQAILTKVKPSGQFWKWVAQKLDIDPAQFLILNPQVLRGAGREHVRLQGRWPTMGLIATTFALHYCDVVDLAGFGYGSSIFNHYYERYRTGGLKTSTHNTTAEKDYLIRLLDEGIISHDLTGVYKDNVT